MKLGEQIRYYLYKCLLRVSSILPWFVLRGLSSALSWVLFRIIKYRQRVVLGNISRSFPDKSPEEVTVLAREFYRRFIFQFLSSPKLLSLSAETLRAKHLKFEGLELFEELQRQGHKHTILLMGHCGNWELFSAGSIYFSSMGIVQEQLYRPMRDKAMDRLLREVRTKYGSLVLPKSDVGRRILEVMRTPDALPIIWAFIADQTPSRAHAHYWTLFLNQPTAFLDGAERLARKLNLPVVYMDISYVSDTEYIGKMKLITATPKACRTHEITETYALLLEKTLQQNPASWLWSHKRWKHHIEDYPAAECSQRLHDYLSQQ